GDKVVGGMRDIYGDGLRSGEETENGDDGKNGSRNFHANASRSKRFVLKRFNYTDCGPRRRAVSEFEKCFVLRPALLAGGFRSSCFRPHFEFRVWHAHQPFVEPPHNVVEPLNPMPRFTRTRQFMGLARKD